VTRERSGPHSNDMKLAALGLGAILVALVLGCSRTITCTLDSRSPFVLEIYSPEGDRICADVSGSLDGEPIKVSESRSGCFYSGPSETAGRFVIEIEHPDYQPERREFVVERDEDCNALPLDMLRVRVELRR
jgi:hypothetical protein